MKDTLEVLDRLAARAREYEAQPLSVADAVVWQLRQPEKTPLLWLTVSAVVVTALLVFAIGFPIGDTDSLDMLFQTANFIQTEEGL